MALRYIYAKDGRSAIRAEMTDDLHTLVWFGHLRYGALLNVGVPSEDKSDAEAEAWVKAERAKPSPVVTAYNPFA